MNARIASKPRPVKNRTTVKRKSDREVVVTRTINSPARIVFEAFAKAELLKLWWVPKSMGHRCDQPTRSSVLVSAGELHVRSGVQGL